MVQKLPVPFRKYQKVIESIRNYQKVQTSIRNYQKVPKNTILVCLRKMSHKTVLIKCLPDKTSADHLVVTLVCTSGNVVFWKNFRSVPMRRWLWPKVELITILLGNFKYCNCHKNILTYQLKHPLLLIIIIWSLAERSYSTYQYNGEMVNLRWKKRQDLIEIWEGKSETY